MRRKVTGGGRGNYKKVTKTRKNILTGRTRTVEKRRIPVYNKKGEFVGYTRTKHVDVSSAGYWHKKKSKTKGIGGSSKDKEVQKGGGRIIKKKSNIGGQRTRSKIKNQRRAQARPRVYGRNK